MKKLIVICLSMGIIFLSCTTTLNYRTVSPNVVDNTQSIMSGYFVSEKNHTNDIVITGKVSITSWGVLLESTNLETYKWKGVIGIMGKEYPLEVSSLVSTSNQTSENKAYQLNSIKIEKVPNNYRFDTFEIWDSINIFKADSANKGMLTQFTIDGNKMYVLFEKQGLHDLFGNEYEPFWVNKFGAMRDNKQIIYIADGSGKKYADFDMNSYRIYETNSLISVEELQYIVSVYSVIQHICGIL